MAQPLVTDYRAIIDAVRRHGSVHHPRTAVPGEFAVWRRRLRQAARVAEVRISITRDTDYVLIENRDTKSATTTVAASPTSSRHTSSEES